MLSLCKSLLKLWVSGGGGSRVDDSCPEQMWNFYRAKMTKPLLHKMRTVRDCGAVHMLRQAKVESRRVRRCQETKAG